MNKTNIIVGVVCFMVGGALSGGLTYHFTKRKYEDILKENTDNYEKLLNSSPIVTEVPEKYRRKSRVAEGPNHEESPKISKEEKDIIKEKLQYNNQKTTAYASMYKTTIKDIIDAQAENDDAWKKSIDIFTSAKEVNETNNSADLDEKNDEEISVISEADFIDICDNHADEWDCDNLFLYNDGTVTTEDDNVIDGVELDMTFGKHLDEFKNSNEKSFYIKNFKLNTVYEILKQNKPFIG